MRILISGAGIAGPTLAYWLVRHGYEPTIVERAPEPRAGGYIIDFWGAGFDVADRMGLVPAIREAGYTVQEVRVVDSLGKRVTGFPAGVFDRLTHGRYASLPRGELSRTLLSAIEGKVEMIFGDSIAGLRQTGGAVQVTFEHADPREFDLVVGADGLHSRVRDLAFGPQPRFERYLGYKAAAFEIPGYRPRDELVYVMYTEVGRQVVRFAMRGDRTMFLFTFADEDAADEDAADAADVAAVRALVRRRFATSGWEVPRILDALDGCDDIYFDRVSQIRMPAEPGSWTRGRVTLIGDAASCVSLLAGQGSSLAMVAAYILAGELHRAGGALDDALRRYQSLFGPFVLSKQNAALRLAGTFAPKSKFSLFLRNQIFSLMRVGWIANWAAGRDLVDRITLPDY